MYRILRASRRVKVRLMTADELDAAGRLPRWSWFCIAASGLVGVVLATLARLATP